MARGNYESLAREAQWGLGRCDRYRQLASHFDGRSPGTFPDVLYVPIGLEPSFQAPSQP